MDLHFQRGAWLIKQGLLGIRAAPWFATSIMLGLIIKENFPFSHWPMYSKFTRQADYIYVVNGIGKPVPTTTFFETAPRLRKQFQRELKTQEDRAVGKAESEKRAAVQVLKRLLQRLPPEQRASLGGLGLVLVQLNLDEHRNLVTSERTIATLGFAQHSLTLQEEGP